MYPPRVHFTSDVSSRTRSKDTSPERREEPSRYQTEFLFISHTQTLTRIPLEPRIPKDIRSKFEYSLLHCLYLCSTATIEGAIRQPAIGGGSAGGWRMALIKGWRAGRGLQRAKGRHRCGGGEEEEGQEVSSGAITCRRNYPRACASQLIRN